MDMKEIERINKLNADIKKLDSVLFNFKRTYKIKLTTKAPKLFLENIAYGCWEDKEFECMDLEMREEIIGVMEKYLYKYKKELEEY